MQFQGQSKLAHKVGWGISMLYSCNTKWNTWSRCISLFAGSTFLRGAVFVRTAKCWPCRAQLSQRSADIISRYHSRICTSKINSELMWIKIVPRSSGIHRYVIFTMIHGYFEGRNQSFVVQSKSTVCFMLLHRTLNPLNCCFLGWLFIHGD